MKKQSLVLLALLLNAVAALSQCDIVITGSFDSECLYDFKEEITDEYPDLMIACKHSTVTYTAYADMGSAANLTYTWELVGDMSHSASGNQLTVDWSDDEWGMVIVSVADGNGDTCTGYSRVKLIDNPTASCSTVPAYTVTSTGDKVVRVCKGNSVQFIDQSTAHNGDIVGQLWSSLRVPSSSTPDFFIDDVYADDVVTHRVYNNCGCYDEETILIEVVKGDRLELACYGTACENSIVAYHATSPVCSDYRWYVEGGTLIAGHGTDSPVVQWNSPADGYGVLGLDGNQCNNQSCPTLMSVKVPVIQGSLAIEGQSDACLGESVLFSLPLLGSTRYDWSITPSTGVDTYLMTHANEIRLVFHDTGTYRLQCSYRCDFLDCGPFEAVTLTVTVKPPLEITGGNSICVANACHLQTTPAVSADWTAYDLANGNQVAATATGPAFSHTFSHAGRYLITAAHPSFCGPTTFVLEVRAAPPAPVLSDLSPSNRHTACPNQGLLLSGTPSEPNFSLVWAPACSTAAPQLYSGDSVTINYQGEVCDVYVYNYDRVLQCLSQDYYVHQVDELLPAHLNIPDNITACPNSVILWGDNAVPDQRDEGVLYEWSIEPLKQHCASVQGSHLSNSITLAVNDIATPTAFYMKLRRTYCGLSYLDTSITISVPGHIQHTVGITGPDTVCVNSAVTYTGTGGTAADYRWTVADTHYSGNPVSHTFANEGIQHVILQENPFTYCTNSGYWNTAVKTVFVSPLPMVQGLVCDNQAGTVSVVPALDPTYYSFTWVYRQDAQSSPVTLFGPYGYTSLGSPGTYYCTVTDNRTGCSRTVNTFYNGNTHGETCNTINLTGDYDYCSHSVSLTSSYHSWLVLWTVSGGDYTIYKHGNNNRYADITFDDIGIYTVTAKSNTSPCYRGKRVITVDFIPEFSFSPGCNKIVIRNRSRYAPPGGTVYITVTSSCNNTEVISMPVSDTSYCHLPSGGVSGLCTYTFTLTGYGSANGNITPCILGTVTTGTPSMPSGADSVSISTANPYSDTTTCDNTPIQLTATLGYPGTITSSCWSFGDGSSYCTDGGSVYHTFRNNGGNNSVNVETTDNYGCTRQNALSLRIRSYENELTNGSLDPIGSIACPHIGTLNAYFNIQGLHYLWWRQHDTTHVSYGNPYPTHRPDYYFVLATDDNYCHKEATTFMGFMNAPIAHIYAGNYNCCVGNEVRLYGRQGPSGNPLGYSWTVTGPANYQQTYTDPDITFLAPAATGQYNVTLTVTDSVTGCSSTASETLTVNTQPAAPSIAVAASDTPCISDAPVHLTASGYTGTVHWSNGETGPDAYYYTHGSAMAYYFDPSIGCPSAKDSLRIHKQPDFNALLTGCYAKCKQFFDYSLPVYGLTDVGQSIGWDWLLNGNSIASGVGNYTLSPLMLPLTGAGSYQMHIDYTGGSCSEASPLLTIADKPICDCDSVQITYGTNAVVKNCRVFYDVTVTVCNNYTSRKFCFEQILADGLTPYITDLGTAITRHRAINPSDCDTFHLCFEAYTVEPLALNFRIVDNFCAECEKAFSVDLSPNTVACEETDIVKWEINTSLTSDAAVYLNFYMDVSSYHNILAFWSEPPMIVNYMYDNLLGTIQGLCMLDYAKLTQLLAEDSVVCFIALTCVNDNVCKLRCCIEAVDIAGSLLALGFGNKLPKGLVPDGGSETGRKEPDNIRLIPNPTTGSCRVECGERSVESVLVMDMHGREMAAFDNTDSFDISALPAGSYIVRTVTKSPKPTTSDKTVSYLKLVKK